MKTNKQAGLPRRSSAEAGQVSRLLLVLAIIVFVAVIITFLIMKMAQQPAAPALKTTPTIPLPVYESTLDNIRFVFESAIDRGNDLRASDIINSQYSSDKKDLTTTEKFIQVTVGAQNMGTENTVQNAWNIENIVDSQGRNFVPEDYNVSPWLPTNNGCGALLKPAFDPTSCTKIYEVSKASTGLKIRVEAGKGGGTVSTDKNDSILIDLIIK